MALGIADCVAKLLEYYPWKLLKIAVFSSRLGKPWNFGAFLSL